MSVQSDSFWGRLMYVPARFLLASPTAILAGSSQRRGDCTIGYGINCIAVGFCGDILGACCSRNI